MSMDQIEKDEIFNVLEKHFDIKVMSIESLSLGNDPRASVYKVGDSFNETYFLKRISGEISKVGVQIPYYLNSQGIHSVIAPIVGKKEDLLFSEKGYTWVLYPFVKCSSGYEVEFSSFQWSAFGESLRNIHAVNLPEDLRQSLPRENFKSVWCEPVKEYDDKLKNTTLNDPVSAKFANFWKEKRNEILALVNNTEQIGNDLCRHTFDFVLCHSDLHPGNTVIDKTGNFIIVDWDTPILAPRERDLMFIGGGHRFKNPDINAFYKGYGRLETNKQLISYYRNNRIVADLAVTADEIYGNKGTEEEREIALYLMMRQFEPNREVDVALASLF